MGFSSGKAAGGGASPGATVASETAFGQAAGAGVANEYSRADHTHGTPVNPVTAHEAAADPHPQYTTQAEVDTTITTHVGQANPHNQYAFASRFKGQRVTTGAIAGGATADVTLTWTTAFADANYTVTAEVVEGTAAMNTLTVRKIVSVTAAAVVVRVENQDGLNARTGTLHVIAIHD